MPSTIRVDDRLRMNTAVFSASPQSQPGIPLAFNMFLAMPSTVWLCLPTTPFCWAVYSAVRWRWTQCSVQ